MGLANISAVRAGVMVMKKKSKTREEERAKKKANFGKLSIIHSMLVIRRTKASAT